MTGLRDRMSNISYSVYLLLQTNNGETIFVPILGT